MAKLETVEEGNTNTVQEPLKDLSNSPQPASKKSLPTPLKRAIASRSAQDNNSHASCNLPPAPTPKKTPMKPKTPVKKRRLAS
ncbi:hypothetical protein EON65_13405 [archaeon]|nr:MAG: hypothetical protein EON65_13405 [archaeon]